MNKFKKTAIGANFAAIIIIAVILLLMVNYLSLRHYRTFDWTRNKLHTLSSVTVNILHRLDVPIRVTVFFQPGHPLYDDVQDTLSLYQKEAKGKLEVEFIDADADLARTQMLAEKLKVDQLNVVVFECSERQKVVTESEIAEYDYSQMQLGGASQMSAFKGEEAFTSAVKTVIEAEQKKVYFLTGHGEKDIDSSDQRNGYSEVRKYMERDNFKVEKIALFGKTEVPQDSDLLVLAGPANAYPEEELTIIEKYLDNGGKLLVLIDPLTKTGLDVFLAKWGIEVGDNIVVDPSMRLPFVNPANLIVNDYPYHEAEKGMKDNATIFFLARSVASGSAVKEGVKVRDIARTTKDGWGETKTDDTTFTYDSSEDKGGPVSIAAAVEKENTGEGKIKGLRIIAVGDSDFPSNSQMGTLGNSDFLMNAVNWLVEREEMIGISPKVPEYVKLTLTERQMKTSVLFSLVGLPVLCIILGGIVWWRRRS